MISISSILRSHCLHKFHPRVFNLFFSRLKFVLITLALTLSLPLASTHANQVKPAIVIHGGAGTILKKNMTPELEKAYTQVMEKALKAGYKILKRGGSSTEAVLATIVIMEDSPLFNAGKGAVFTNDGKNELDASIMDGSNLNAGAIAGVTKVKNPILLAEKVMNQSKHVFMAREGAEKFAKMTNIELIDPAYFYTERRWNQLQSKLKAEKAAPDFTHWTPFAYESKFGTVGAAALDINGNISAGTSTGGMTNKHFARIGDSPVIGAGTYADNESCGISATGHGEYFIRAAVAHDICARAKYKGISLQAAADEVIKEKLLKMGGMGGIIGIDPAGNPVYSFNTSGMYRGAIKTDGTLETAIYK